MAAPSVKEGAVPPRIPPEPDEGPVVPAMPWVSPHRFLPGATAGRISQASSPAQPAQANRTDTTLERFRATAKPLA